MGTEILGCPVISSEPRCKVFGTFPIDLRGRMAIEKIIKKSEKELQAI